MDLFVCDHCCPCTETHNKPHTVSMQWQWLQSTQDAFRCCSLTCGSTQSPHTITVVTKWVKWESRPEMWKWRSFTFEKNPQTIPRPVWTTGWFKIEMYPFPSCVDRCGLTWHGLDFTTRLWLEPTTCDTTWPDFMKKKVISANQICIYLLYKLYLLDVFVKDVFWTWTSCGYLLVFTAWWPLVPTCPQMSQGRPFF